MLGGTEIIVLVALAIAVFYGPEKIREFASALGEAKGEFEKGKNSAEGISEEVDEVKEDLEE